MKLRRNALDGRVRCDQGRLGPGIKHAQPNLGYPERFPADRRECLYKRGAGVVPFDVNVPRNLHRRMVLAG